MNSTRPPARKWAPATYVCTDPDLDALTGDLWLGEWWRRENRPPVSVERIGVVQLPSGRTAPWWRAVCHACAPGHPAVGGILYANLYQHQVIDAGVMHVRERHLRRAVAR